MKHLFIINRNAGKSKSYVKVAQALSGLKGDNIVVKYTEKPGDAKLLAREFVSGCDDFVRVYACGGDGTLNEVVSGIYDLPNCALVPVPVGSGNDFVRSFDCEQDGFLDIDKLMNGSEEQIDLIMCNDRICCNSVTIGFDCAVAKNVDKFKKRKFISSSMAYKLSIFYCLFSGRKHNFRAIVDGSEIDTDGTVLLSLCAKGKYYGGGIKCAPKADNSDGYMDFMLIPTIAVPRFVKLLPSFIKGEHLDNPKMGFIRYQKCREVEYILDGETEIGIDGEILTVTEAKIRVLPGALRVVLPK